MKRVNYNVFIPFFSSKINVLFDIECPPKFSFRQSGIIYRKCIVLNYLLLFVTLIAMSAQSVLTKHYNVKAKVHDAFLFSGVSSVSALLFFIISSGFKLQFNVALLPYSIGFAITYGLALVGSNLAIAHGSLALTSLVSSYSLIIPTLFGIIFLKESIDITVYIGIALLLISLFLINFKNETFKFSFIWLVCVVIAFISNGMCSTIQKMQQIKFSGAFKSEFMIFALFFVSFLLLTISFIRQKQRILALKSCITLAPINGFANGAVNLLVMLLTGVMPNAFLFPMLSAGSIAVMFIFSLTVYKERFSVKQYIGYIIGVGAIILMNL